MALGLRDISIGRTGEALGTAGISLWTQIYTVGPQWVKKKMTSSGDFGFEEWTCLGTVKILPTTLEQDTHSFLL